MQKKRVKNNLRVAYVRNLLRKKKQNCIPSRHEIKKVIKSEAAQIEEEEGEYKTPKGFFLAIFFLSIHAKNSYEQIPVR